MAAHRSHSIRFSQCGTGSIAPNFGLFNHNLWRLIKLLIRAVSFSIRSKTVKHEHMCECECVSTVLYIEFKRRNVYLILSLNTAFFVPFKSHLDILIASELYACVSERFFRAAISSPFIANWFFFSCMSANIFVDGSTSSLFELPERRQKRQPNDGKHRISRKLN